MILREVQLLLSKLYICAVCGRTAEDPKSLAHCAQAPMPSIPPLIELYQEVDHFAPPYSDAPSHELRKERSTVTRLFYAQTGQSFLYRSSDKVELHELCLELSQSFDCASGPNRPWKEGDNIIGFQSMTYAHFLLWQEGDRAKLEAARLLAPIPQKKIHADNQPGLLKRLFSPRK